MNQVTIENKWLSLSVLDYGAIIQKMQVKKPSGGAIDVILGYDILSDYLDDPFFHGACIGRYAGRISKNGFSLNGHNYPLFAPNKIHLHGGKKGFSKQYWNIDTVVSGEAPSITLSYLSPHLEEGYPGNLKVTVTYKLVQNALYITHKATTDLTTVINLTNHSYFKLDTVPSIGHYHLKLPAKKILETDHFLIPTGNFLPVKNTEFDFSSGKEIGKLHLDTPFVLDGKSSEVIEAYSKTSGLSLQIGTNQPGAVIYTPKEFPAICFETQNFPDAPNHPSFPSSVVSPGEIYDNTSVFKFGFIH